MLKNTQLAIELISNTVKNENPKIQFELTSTSHESRSISFEEKKLSELSLGSSYTLGVRLVDEDRECFFSTESLEKEDLERLCQQQIQALAYAKRNPNLKLSSLTDLATEQSLDIYHTENITIEKKIDRVRELELMLLECDESVKNVRYAGYSQAEIKSDTVTSTGLVIPHSKTKYSVHGELLCKSGESLASDGYGQTRYKYEDLLSNEELVAIVKNRAVSLLNSSIPATGKYPVVISSDSFSKLLSLILPMFNADNVDKGQSLFENKLGQRIASPLFQLSDEPHNLNAGNCYSIDGEGYPTKNKNIIGDGNLNIYLSNLEYAKKLGIEHTHNALRSGTAKVAISASNIFVRPGTMKPSVLKGMRPKLIEITNMHGLHVGFNKASGDFSFQAEGFLLEMSTRVCSLQNFVCSGNILDLLLNIGDLGSELSKTGGRIICPDVLIEELQIVGK